MLFVLSSLCSATPIYGSSLSSTSAPIQYTLGTPVLTGPINIYNIYYGNWTETQKSIVDNYAREIGTSAWWGIEKKYYYQANENSEKMYVSSNVTLAATVTNNYTKGFSLANNDLPDLIQYYVDAGILPEDSNAVYFILTSGDVAESMRPDLGTAAFCSDYCGYHVSTELKSGKRVYYAQVGIPTACISGCTEPSNRFVSPNNDVGLDSLISAYAHELAEAVSDPRADIDNERAWQDDSGFENADKCSYKYGQTYKTANGANANQRINGKDYLIQSNWDPVKQACANA